MKKIWFYPFIAGFYDFYFVSLLLGAIVALGVSIVQIPISIIIALIILSLSLLTSIVYHALLTKHFQYLSPGEIIVGRKIQNSHKAWINPYNYNRWALFLVIALDLLILGNSWDSLSEGYIYSFIEVVIRVVIITLVLYGLIDLGRGRIRGVMYPIFYLVLLAFQTANASFPAANRDALQLVAMILIGIALLNLVITSIYGFLRNKHNSKVI